MMVKMKFTREFMYLARINFFKKLQPTCEIIIYDLRVYQEGVGGLEK